LTGLATVHHVRLRLEEIYGAGGEATGQLYTLVVLELADGAADGDPCLVAAFAPGLQAALAGDLVRETFPRTETVARIARRTLVAIASERDCTEVSTWQLRRRLEALLPHSCPASVTFHALASHADALDLLEGLLASSNGAGPMQEFDRLPDLCPRRDRQN